MAKLVRVHQQVTLRQVIDALLDRSGLNQTELAKKLHVTRAAISRAKIKNTVGRKLRSALYRSATMRGQGCTPTGSTIAGCSISRQRTAAGWRLDNKRLHLADWWPCSSRINSRSAIG